MSSATPCHRCKLRCAPVGPREITQADPGKGIDRRRAKKRSNHLPKPAQNALIVRDQLVLDRHLRIATGLRLAPNYPLAVTTSDAAKRSQMVDQPSRHLRRFSRRNGRRFLLQPPRITTPAKVRHRLVKCLSFWKIGTRFFVPRTPPTRQVVRGLAPSKAARFMRCGLRW